MTVDRDAEQIVMATYGGCVMMGLVASEDVAHKVGILLGIRSTTLKDDKREAVEVYINRDQAGVLASYLEHYAKTGSVLGFGSPYPAPETPATDAQVGGKAEES